MGQMNNLVIFTRRDEILSYFIYTSGKATLNRIIIQDFESEKNELLKQGWLIK